VKKLLLILFLLTLIPVASFGACTGTSPNLTAPTWADLQACHNIAHQGDTITITPGTYIAPIGAFTTITKFVKIDATGVTVIDNTCYGHTNCYDWNEDMLAITESPAGNTDFKNLTIQQGTAIHSSPSGVISLYGGGKPARIHGLTMNYTQSSGDFFIVHVNSGVIDHNVANGAVEGEDCVNNSSFARIIPFGGVAGWETPVAWGDKDIKGDQHVYFEDNTLNYMDESPDIDMNGQAIFRHNTFYFTSGGSHGTDSSGILGARSGEFYDNTFIYTQTPVASCGGLWPNSNGILSFRGGTFRVFKNTIPQVDTGAAWGGVKNALHLYIENLNRAAGGFPCWNRLTDPGAGYPVPHQVGWGWINGTGATIVLPSWDDPGIDGIPLTETQDLEPVLYFTNTGGGNYDNIEIDGYPDDGTDDSCSHAFPSLAPFDSPLDYVKPNRDFYQQVANFNGTSGTGFGPRASRPSTCHPGVVYWSNDQGTWDNGAAGSGVLDKCVAPNTWRNAWYVPYPYPHPLAGGGNTAGTTGGSTGVGTPVEPVAATLVSGSKDSRPQLDRLMSDARVRSLDGVIVARFDRFARSTRHLILALEEFNSLGVDLSAWASPLTRRRQSAR
jgi:hypothetical protein